jgi:LuxR family transcriptional regulator, maltose regulon positive regulatory protein
LRLKSKEGVIAIVKRHPLRVERELRGWSQARVAEAIGTSTRTMVRWEQGEVLPQPFYRERLCELFSKNALELGIQSFLAAQSTELHTTVQSLSTISGTTTPIVPSDNAAISFDQDQVPAALSHDPLLSTKFFVPISTHALVRRTRLIDLLMAGTKSTLTLLSAPAGSGKTTLIAEWLRSFSLSAAPAWVSLDEEDNDPERFWLYVLTALDHSQPGLYTPLINSLRSHKISSWPSFLKHLLNTLLASDQPRFLVLDDYHVITEQTVHSSMAYFLEHLPIHVHLIVSTRHDPPWPLSRLRARRQLQEIRMDQLCGTAEEVGTFFSQVMQIEIPAQMVEEVTARTEGWMVGIQLLALSLRGRTDVTDILDMLRGDQRDILDYLLEEVVTYQSATIQDFLLCTSILEHLEASCCDAVIATQGSQRILEFLERANLFVVALDHQRHWYRYHHLFAQALRTRLEGTYEIDKIRTLHRRASIWFSQHGSPREMIPHALYAQEWMMAADAIEHTPHQHLWGSQHTLLHQWIEKLPSDIFRSRPNLCLRHAVLLLWNAHTTKCEYWLSETEKTLIAQDDALTTGDEQRRKLFGEITTVRALIAVMRGEGQEAIALCQEAGRYFTIQDLPLRSQITFYLAQAYYLCDKSMLAIQQLQDAIKLAAAAGDYALENMVTGNMMLQLSILGHLKQAWSLGKHITASQEPLLSASVSWPYIYQADILREWNDLDTAIDLAEQAIQRGKESKKIMLIPHWEAILAHCFFSKGDLDAMEQILQQAELLNEQLHDPTRLGSYITVERVRLWITRGDLENANRWAYIYLAQDDEPSLMARILKDIVLIRVLMANTAYGEALKRLNQALQQARAAQRDTHVIELLILRALIYQATHEELSACASLTEALDLAQAEGYVRIFVDEGIPLAKLLIKLKIKQQKHTPESYVDALLAAFPSEKIA